MAIERPIGFSPAEISARVNLEVLQQHAEEAALMWVQRDRAARAPQYYLRQLRRLDNRLEAHVEGLKVAGDAGWALCQTELVKGSEGAVFAAASAAFSALERRWMSVALDAGCSRTGAFRELVSALGWLEYQDIHLVIDRLLNAESPIHRSVGLAACGAHRQDPGSVLPSMLNSGNSWLRARALRLVGEIKREDCLPQVREHLSDSEVLSRLWAAWTLSLFGDSGGSRALLTLAESELAYRDVAMKMALRTLDAAEARAWIRRNSSRRDLTRSVIKAVGVLGDPTVVPWLITKMEDGVTARVAGGAFCAITGVDLSDDDLEGDPPATEDQAEEDGDQEDLDLQWPSIDRVHAWWSKNQARFTAGGRYLRGRPVTPLTLRETLRDGTQRQREAAAIELAILERPQMMFNVRASSRRQRALLAAAG